MPEDLAREVTIKGRDVQTGSPRAAEVTSEEVCIAAEDVVKRLARVVNRALADLQPEVAADIYDRGLILTGGGALLDGMPQFLQRETNLQPSGGSTAADATPLRSSIRSACNFFVGSGTAFSNKRVYGWSGSA